MASRTGAFQALTILGLAIMAPDDWVGMTYCIAAGLWAVANIVGGRSDE